MSFQVRGLRSGDVISGKFHGSRMLGNDPYVLDGLKVKSIDTYAGSLVLQDESMEFEVYKFNGYWAYGSSAEKFTVLAKA